MFYTILQTFFKKYDAVFTFNKKTQSVYEFLIFNGNIDFFGLISYTIENLCIKLEILKNEHLAKFLCSIQYYKHFLKNTRQFLLSSKKRNLFTNF